MFGRSSGKIDLPSVPAALARIIQITNRPDATPEQVASVVMLDQSLCTKVLRLANSAYFGRRKQIETVTEAIVILGFSPVKNLAASASLVDALFPKQLFPGFCWQDMWSHSVTCGLAAEPLYERMVGFACGTESAFVAGLLHDVGKLVLARALPHKFVEVVGVCREYGCEMMQAESKILGTNHCKLGGDLARQWGFPDKLTAGIELHHTAQDSAEHEDIARAVQASNMLAKRICRNYLVGVRVDISLKDVADCADLSLGDVEFVVDQVHDGLRHCSEILSWGNSTPGAESLAA